MDIGIRQKIVVLQFRGNTNTSLKYDHEETAAVICRPDIAV